MTSLRVAILKRKMRSSIIRLTLKLAILSAIAVAIARFVPFQELWKLGLEAIGVAAMLAIIVLDVTLFLLGKWSISKTLRVEGLWQKRWGEISRLSKAIAWPKTPPGEEEARQLWDQIPFDPQFTFYDPLEDWTGEVFHAPAMMSLEAILASGAWLMAKQCYEHGLKEFVVFRVKAKERDLVFMKVYVPYEGTWKGHLSFRIGVDTVAKLSHIHFQAARGYRVIKPWKEGLVGSSRPRKIREDAYYAERIYAKTKQHNYDGYQPIISTRFFKIRSPRFFFLTEFISSIVAGWPFWSTYMRHIMPADIGDEGEDHAIGLMRTHRSGYQLRHYSWDEIGVDLPESELRPLKETSSAVTAKIKEALHDWIAKRFHPK